MNPQPSNTTVNIFTGLFLFFFFYFFFNGKKQSVDMLNLGMIYDQPVQTVNQPIQYTISFAQAPVKPIRKTKPTQKQKHKKPPKIKSSETETTPVETVAVQPAKPETKEDKIRYLAKDCYETLLAIGYKKREAKKLVEDYFRNNPNPDIIQFIKDITFKA